MGNICNGNHDRDDIKDTTDPFNKNCPICQFTLRKLFTIDLVLGTYRCHKGSLLLVIVQQQYLEYSTELRDYSQNFSTVVDAVSTDRKKLLSVNISRNCPFKRLQLCVLPPYTSQQSESYMQQFTNMIKQVLTLSNDITIQMSHTSENTNGIPNQTLMAVFFQNVIKNLAKPLKLSIISSQAKLLNMIRYEVIKLEDYIVTPFVSVKQNK